MYVSEVDSIVVSLVAAAATDCDVTSSAISFHSCFHWHFELDKCVINSRV